jgi:hypothetical protein
MISNRIEFYVAFASLPRPVEDVWQTIVSILSANKCLPKEFSLSQIAGHPKEIQSERYLFLDADEVKRTIIERNLKGFHVNTGFSSRSIDFWLANIENTGSPARLTVKLGEKTKTPPTWNSLIEALLVQWPCIGAWQWACLYSGWQNAGNAEYYERWYGEMPPGIEHVELPGALQPRPWLRLPNAPGRRKELLPAIDFHPSAEIWLGPHFWQYAKCTKEEALAAGFWLEARDTPHFTYFKCWPTAFTRPDGDQGRMQQRLWKLFFNEDCEWPPGSGTICDEPMYGPPELMPGHQASNSE